MNLQQVLNYSNLSSTYHIIVGQGDIVIGEGHVVIGAWNQFNKN